MARVNWAEHADKYEDMGSVLISILHPTSQRIDGAGGDGGRDVQMPTPDGLILYELKSFTGRLGAAGGRRRQVEKSLARAALLKPKSWNLVVPIDPTPEELDWFEGLKKNYPFDMNWLGKTWLDGQMARHPQIPRYFLEDGSNEAIRLLREFHEMQAAAESTTMGGATDGLRAIADRLNDISPFYAIEVNVGPDGVEVGVRPRYVGAERDAPILVQLEGRFPESAEGRRLANQFREAIEYGREMHLGPENIAVFKVQAPGGILPTEFQNTSVKVGPTEDVTSWRAQGKLHVVTPDGARLTTLPVVIQKTGQGTHGLLMRAQDRSLALTVDLKVPLAPSGPAPGTFHFRAPDDALPGDFLPALRLVARAFRPNHLELELNGAILGRLELPKKRQISADYIRLIEALARVQDATQTYFPVPETIPDKDSRGLGILDHLVRGKTITMKANGAAELGIVVQDPGQLEHLFTGDDTFGIALDVNHTETFAGHELTLQSAELWLPAAKFGPEAKTLLPLTVGAVIKVPVYSAENHPPVLSWKRDKDDL